MAETYEDLGRKVAQTVPRAFRKQDEEQRCPKCGAEIDVPDADGDTIACPVCGEEVAIKADKAATRDALAKGKAPLYASAAAFKALGDTALWKLDEKTHSVYGLGTAEIPDSDSEIAGYLTPPRSTWRGARPWLKSHAPPVRPSVTATFVINTRQPLRARSTK